VLPTWYPPVLDSSPLAATAMADVPLTCWLFISRWYALSIACGRQYSLANLQICKVSWHNIPLFVTLMFREALCRPSSSYTSLP